MDLQEADTSARGEIKTWDPFIGCKYSCVYCMPTCKNLVRQVALMVAAKCGTVCKDCVTFTPHEHPDRLDTLPSGAVISIGTMGDIAFARPDYIRRIITAVKRNGNPNQDIYWQTKNPRCLEPFLKDLPYKSILMTTIETNRNAGYHKISYAPLPSERYKDFKALSFPRKAITIEPILDFDPDVLFSWMLSIRPMKVFIGYNTSRDTPKLPEPSIEKTQAFIGRLREIGIDVKVKTMISGEGNIVEEPEMSEGYLDSEPLSLALPLYLQPAQVHAPA